jgi:hypothetical protein
LTHALNVAFNPEPLSIIGDMFMKNKDLISISSFMHFLEIMDNTRRTDNNAFPSDVGTPI